MMQEVDHKPKRAIVAAVQLSSAFLRVRGEPEAVKRLREQFATWFSSSASDRGARGR